MVEKKFVHCAVRTDFLYKIQTNFTEMFQYTKCRWKDNIKTDHRKDSTAPSIRFTAQLT